MVNRRNFIVIFGSALLQLMAADFTSAKSIDHAFRGVNAIYFYASVTSESKLRNLIPVNQILEDVKSFLTASLRETRPDIIIVYRPYDSPQLPPEAFEPTTLKVLIQITLREWHVGKVTSNQLLGSIGIELSKPLKRRGGSTVRRLSLATEPFAATKGSRSIREQLLRAVKSQLDVGVIRPLQMSYPTTRIR